MSELLSYQMGNFKARVSVSGDGGFSAELKKTGDKMTLDLISPEEISGTCYVFSGGELFICSGNVKIKLDGGAEKPTEVFECFELPTDAGWKISEVKLGGTETLMCVSSEATIYFDKISHCPYKIEKNGVTADVLSFEVINVGEAE